MVYFDFALLKDRNHFCWVILLDLLTLFILIHQLQDYYLYQDRTNNKTQQSQADEKGVICCGGLLKANPF